MGFRIRSRQSIPSGSQRPFQVEHVISYPGDYSPAFASSAILYPLAIRQPRGMLTWSIHQETIGLTEFHDDDMTSRVLPIHRRCYVSVTEYTSRAPGPPAILAQARSCSYFRLSYVTVVQQFT
jgi:hypothetical protein